jgi:hypothetical protein
MKINTKQTDGIKGLKNLLRLTRDKETLKNKHNRISKEISNLIRNLK